MDILLERIKELCKARGISVSTLEMRLNLPENTIYQWKKRIPKTDRLQLVADFFNTTMDYLLGNTDNKDKLYSNDDLKDMVDSAMSFDGVPLSDHDKDVILSYLEGRFGSK